MMFKFAVRLTCDARPVNKALKRTRYKAFHQMKIAEKSCKLTTITTHKGLFRYKRLHIGKIRAEIFTEKIREMLSDIRGQVNMTDYILVFGKSKEEHQANLEP
jgi:hypothetical protein